MRLLILGGTRFVGLAVAASALARGWEVTTFNRGLSGADLEGVTALRGDRRSPDDLASLRSAGSWDAAIDTSGYVPRETLTVCRLLESVVGQYLFMSTVSVYQDWPKKPLSEESETLPCPSDAGPDFGEDTEDGPTRYGYQKSGCEAAALSVFGSERTAILRPGVVLGPHEYVGRLPWWLNRISRGGRILAPGTPDRSIQPIDVRDLAAFALTIVGGKMGGTWNVTAPIGLETFGGMLEACRKVTDSDAQFQWVTDEALIEIGVRQWSELPLWRAYQGVWQVDSSAAGSAGLQCRPLTVTVADTWKWMLDSGTDFTDMRASEIGISSEKERQILATLS